MPPAGRDAATGDCHYRHALILLSIFAQVGMPNNMRIVLLVAALMLVHPARLLASEPVVVSIGDKVYPRVGAVVLVDPKVLNEGHFKKCPWPMHDVNGRWLWVGRDHKGWVRRNQVITRKELSTYLDELAKKDNSGKALDSYLRSFDFEFEVTCGVR